MAAAGIVNVTSCDDRVEYLGRCRQAEGFSAEYSSFYNGNYDSDGKTDRGGGSDSVNCR